MNIKGTITHVEVEGGFWGIMSDDGIPYRPVDGLPKDFLQEGLRIKATVERAQVVSSYMWGRDVHLTKIDLID